MFAQNVETVRRLTHPVRDPRASYEQTLRVLEHAKKHNPKVLTKTSLMLGLGETEEEILEVARDLRGAGVDIFTMGQYLAPSEMNHPVRRYYTPEEFTELGRLARTLGFHHVESAPLVRSSYMAHRAVRPAEGLG